MALNLFKKKPDNTITILFDEYRKLTRQAYKSHSLELDLSIANAAIASLQEELAFLREEVALLNGNDVILTRYEAEEKGEST